MEMSETKINIEKDVNIHLENKKISRSFFWFVWMIYVIVSMTKNCYNGALASIVSEGILTKSQTGFITAMFYLVYTPLQIVGGVVADRFSPEKMIKIGLLGAATANTIIFFNQNYYVMLAAWMFNGIIQFGIWPSIFKIISAQLVRSDRSRMTFYISFTTAAGLFMSYLIAAVVPTWEYNFAVSAISLLICAIALHFFDKRINSYMKWDKDKNIEKKPESQKSPTKVSTIRILKASGFFFVLFSTVFAILVSQSRSTLASVLFIENYDNISPSVGNILTTVLIISGILGTFIAKKFISKVKNEVVAIIMTLTAMIPLFCVCLFVGDVPISATMVVLCCIACLESIVGILRNNYNMHFVKYGKSGTVAGIMNMGLSMGFLLAAYVMPRIVEAFGWRTLIAVWIFLIVAAVITLCLALRKFKQFIETFF